MKEIIKFHKYHTLSCILRNAYELYTSTMSGTDTFQVRYKFKMYIISLPPPPKRLRLGLFLRRTASKSLGLCFLVYDALVFIMQTQCIFCEVGRRPLMNWIFIANITREFILGWTSCVHMMHLWTRSPKHCGLQRKSYRYVAPGRGPGLPVL
jgi:hypothetical protein